MVGLTTDGLRAKIKNQKFILTEDEAIDMFFIYPELVVLEWEKGNVILASVSGLNLDFKIGA